MEFDDEAFARQLQQQLLDEERALMEAQQQQQAQQQQPMQQPAQAHLPQSQPYQYQQPPPAHPGTLEAGGKTRQEQEEEDARLARMLAGMMEQTGASLRNFNFEAHHAEPSTTINAATHNMHQNSQIPAGPAPSGMGTPLTYHPGGNNLSPAPNVARQKNPPPQYADSNAIQMDQRKPPPVYPDQIPGAPSPQRAAAAPPFQRNISGSQQGSVGRAAQRKPPSEPTPAPSAPQRKPPPQSSPPPTEYQPNLGGIGAQGTYEPKKPPQAASYEPKAPPQYQAQRRDNPMQRQPQRHLQTQGLDPNQRQGQGWPPSPAFDPSPLNQGPLGGGSNTKSAARPPQGRAVNQSPKRGANAPARAHMPAEPDILKGDAFLDVPTPAKKDKKKKKRGIFGFGLLNGKKDQENDDRKQERRSSNKSIPENARPASAGSSAFAFARRAGNAKQDSSRSRGEENPIVPFPIPEPVARPADTIGAKPGPLPYSLFLSKDAPSLPEETVGRRTQLLGRNTGTCAVCRQPAQNPLNALDKKYHPECFRCITCHEQIDPSNPFAFVENNGDKQPMHRKCYAELYGIKCAVCKHSIPAGLDGKVSFVKHPFFDTEQMCPHHARNMTRRCTGCHRFEPEGEPFADLNDVGRCVCLACCRTVVVDSTDAQPLWTKVIEFFENKLNMPIWGDLREVPILVVGYNALNDQMSNTSNVHGGASQIMTRGLCLTEHESGRRFKMKRMKFNRESVTFVASDAEDRGFTYFQVPDARKVNPEASVTAILCLSGLPKDLAASVLAHEATHAWIKLHPRFDIQRPIPPQVEEGCAQLIALLFLNDGLDPAPELANNDGSGPSDEKLRQYFKYSIETDDHEIYGMGYRKAATAYSKIGIEALMSHIVLYQDFPET